MRAWKKEKATEEEIKKEMEEATAKITLDHGFELASVPCSDFQDITFNFSQDTAEIKIELER